jgi:hypothetical protein
MKETKRDARRATVLNEFLLTVRRPRRGRCGVEIDNAKPRDRRFFRALAELVGAWFDRP